MKSVVKFLLKKVSRIIWKLYRFITITLLFITPYEIKLIRQKKTKIENKLEDHVAEETFLRFKDDFKKSVLFVDIWKIREYAIKTALLNDEQKEYCYLEFGVYKGASANFFSKFVNRLHVFDSFEGLNEDWGGRSFPKGHFDLKKKIPKFNTNININIGWVEDTLDDFLIKYNPKINFIHLDLDTYGPTKFTLKKIKPYLVKNATIIFDEFYNYVGWENGEYKAFKEIFEDEEYEIKAFHIKGEQCVVQIK